MPPAYRKNGADLHVLHDSGFGNGVGMGKAFGLSDARRPEASRSSMLK